MKFLVERDVLADAVAWAARALPIRPSAPVLAGLLIEAGPLDEGGEGLQLSTFDYETSAQITVKADVADDGVALLVPEHELQLGQLGAQEVPVAQGDLPVPHERRHRVSTSPVRAARSGRSAYVKV